METVELSCEQCQGKTRAPRSALEQGGDYPTGISCEHCGQELVVEDTASVDAKSAVTRSAAQLLSSVDEDDEEEVTIFLEDSRSSRSDHIIDEAPTPYLSGDSGSIRPHSLDNGLQGDESREEETRSAPSEGGHPSRVKPFIPRMNLPWTLAALAVLAFGISWLSQDDGGTQLDPGSHVAKASESEKLGDGSPNQEHGEQAVPSEARESEESVPTFSLEDVVEDSGADAEMPPSSQSNRAERASAHVAPGTKAKSEPAVPSSVPSSEGTASTGQSREEPGEFDRGAARAALREAAVLASACERPGDPSGNVRVALTFGPSGNVVWAAVKDPVFSRTETGTCIAGVFRSVTVPPFNLDRMTMSQNVKIH